jgi:hypothetical protein
MKRGYIIVLVLIFSALACGIPSTATQVPTETSHPVVTVTVQSPSSTATIPVVPNVTATPVNTPTPEKPTKTPYPTSVLDPQMSSDISQIQSQVVSERGLQQDNPVPAVLLTTDQLKQNVVNDFLADYTQEQSNDDVIELSTIGLLDPGFDLRGFYITLLGEQVAGYYDNDTKEMFIVSDTGFNGPEHLTYAHEYTHALQDQNFNLNSLNFQGDVCNKESDRCDAVLALVEGDATLSEFTWYANYASAQDQQEIVTFYNSFKQPIYDSAPAFLQDDFIFPYNQGLSFVTALHDSGGFSSVNAAFHNPPASTEQILHPALYPSDTPVAVTLPDLLSALGSGWREVSHNKMGEWYDYLILARGVNASARQSESTAQEAAAGWGGDDYIVFHQDADNQTVFVMKTVWDTPNDATQFASTFQQYATTRFGVSAAQDGNTLSWTYSGGYTSLVQSGSTTIWINAPDSSTAQVISGLVQP